MMQSKVKKESPEYSAEVLDKVVGDLWYNRMDSQNKKDITKRYES